MRFLYVLFAVMAVLLFYGGPDSESHRIYKNMWDLGHVLFFLLYSILIIKYYTKRVCLNTILIILLSSFVLGLMIEIVQSNIGRNFEFKDILADILGSMLGITIAYYVEVKSTIKKIFLLSMTFAMILFSLYSLILTIVDEVNMRNEFPIIVDFNSKLQLLRFDNNEVNTFLSDTTAESDKRQLVVEMLPAKYPDLTLKHFYRDWTNFTKMNFRIYNFQEDNINLHLKIYDVSHIDNGYKYNDRFNKVLNLTKGWNNYSVSLESIKKSPKNRLMDVSQISSVSFFMRDLIKKKKIALDNITLR